MFYKVIIEIWFTKSCDFTVTDIILLFCNNHCESNQHLGLWKLWQEIIWAQAGGPANSKPEEVTPHANGTADTFQGQLQFSDFMTVSRERSLGVFVNALT